MSFSLFQARIPFKEVEPLLHSITPGSGFNAEEWAAKEAASASVGDMIFLLDPIMSLPGSQTLTEADKFRVAHVLLVFRKSAGQSMCLAVASDDYEMLFLENILCVRAEVAQKKGQGFYYLHSRSQEPLSKNRLDDLADMHRWGENGRRNQVMRGLPDPVYVFLNNVGVPVDPVFIQQPMDIKSLGYFLFTNNVPNSTTKVPNLRQYYRGVAPGEGPALEASPTNDDVSRASSWTFDGDTSAEMPEDWMPPPPPLQASASAASVVIDSSIVLPENFAHEVASVVDNLKDAANSENTLEAISETVTPLEAPTPESAELLPEPEVKPRRRRPGRKNEYPEEKSADELLPLPEAENAAPAEAAAYTEITDAIYASTQEPDLSLPLKPDENTSSLTDLSEAIHSVVSDTDLQPAEMESNNALGQEEPEHKAPLAEETRVFATDYMVEPGDSISLSQLAASEMYGEMLGENLLLNEKGDAKPELVEASVSSEPKASETSDFAPDTVPDATLEEYSPYSTGWDRSNSEFKPDDGVWTRTLFNEFVPDSVNHAELSKSNLSEATADSSVDNEGWMDPPIISSDISNSMGLIQTTEIDLQADEIKASPELMTPEISSSDWTTEPVPATMEETALDNSSEWTEYTPPLVEEAPADTSSGWTAELEPAPAAVEEVLVTESHSLETAADDASDWTEPSLLETDWVEQVIEETVPNNTEMVEPPVQEIVQAVEASAPASETAPPPLSEEALIKMISDEAGGKPWLLEQPRDAGPRNLAVSGLLDRLQQQAFRATVRLEEKLDKIQKGLLQELDSSTRDIAFTEQNNLKALRDEKENYFRQIKETSEDARIKIEDKVQSSLIAVNSLSVESFSRVTEDVDQLQSQIVASLQEMEKSVISLAGSLNEKTDLRYQRACGDLQTQIGDAETKIKELNRLNIETMKLRYDEFQLRLDELRQNIEDKLASVVGQLNKELSSINSKQTNCLEESVGSCLNSVSGTASAIENRLFLRVEDIQTMLIAPKLGELERSLQALTAEFLSKHRKEMEMLSAQQLSSFEPLAQRLQDEIGEILSQFRVAKESLEGSCRAEIEKKTIALQAYMQKHADELSTLSASCQNEIEQLRRTLDNIVAPVGLKEDQALKDANFAVQTNIVSTGRSLHTAITGALEVRIAEMEDQKARVLQERLISFMEEEAYTTKKIAESGLERIRTALNAAFNEIQEAQDRYLQ